MEGVTSDRTRKAITSLRSALCVYQRRFSRLDLDAEPAQLLAGS
jgi:hypothetical protein